MPATKENELYLTEKKLGETLEKIFPDVEWIHNRKVPNSGINNRPDYRSDDLMLIVEFDGNRHYQQVDLIQKDCLKDATYEVMGYKVVRIPYFVQLSRDSIKLFFDKDIPEWEQVYDHGFIADNCVLGGDFCGVGGNRFWEFMGVLYDSEHRIIFYHIIESMVHKVIEGYDKGVFPLNFHLDRVIPVNAPECFLYEFKEGMKAITGEDSEIYGDFHDLWS